MHEDSLYGAGGGPINDVRTSLPITGVFTGFARPKNSTKALPPHRVVMLSFGTFWIQTSFRRSMLFATHTFPAGSTTTPVKYCIPFPSYPVLGGEIGSPVLLPGGHVSVRTPQSSVTVLPKPFAIHTWSFPSMVIPQGPMMLCPPLNGDPGPWVPSGRIMLTLPLG